MAFAGVFLVVRVFMIDFIGREMIWFDVVCFFSPKHGCILCRDVLVGESSQIDGEDATQRDAFQRASAIDSPSWYLLIKQL